jgi:hypothetical protein
MAPGAQFAANHGASRDDSRRLVALAEQGQQVWDELAMLIAAAQRAGREGQAFLLEALETSPYLTLAAAAAGGYLLGGGMPAWAMRRAFDFGSRITGMFVLQRLFDAAARADLASGEHEDAPVGERF